MITHVASAKRSDQWDTEYESYTPDPIFKLAAMPSYCGYAPRYWGAGVLDLRATEGFTEHLECWGTDSLFVFAFTGISVSIKQKYVRSKWSLGRSHDHGGRRRL